jgi:Protein of unknown function (DUF1449)
MLFHPSNLPYWIFLSLGVFLFLVIILSGSGNHDFGSDCDTTVDLDFDASLDHALDGGVDSSLHAWDILGGLGIGKAPLMLLLASDLSILGLSGWILNVTVGQFLGWLPSPLVEGALFLGSMAIALFIGSLIAQPIGQAFAGFGEDASGDRLIGCLGTVSSANIPMYHNHRIGQVDVIDPAHNRVTINATLPPWASVIPHLGDPVLVIDHQSTHYIVIAKDSIDQEQWQG